MTPFPHTGMYMHMYFEECSVLKSVLHDCIVRERVKNVDESNAIRRDELDEEI
jgi:hypothetical protein